MKTFFSKILLILIALLSILISCYAFSYLLNFQNKSYSFLSQKSQELVKNVFWHVGFYMHIGFSGIALSIGWTGFIKRLRIGKFKKTHQFLGKIYVFTTFLGSVSGICIGFFAEGGPIAKIGFISLGIIWFSTTYLGYKSIRKRNITDHQTMMLYSYSLCFAAVTLRIWFPILQNYFEEFNSAYRIVAWLCWIPNLLMAHFMILNKRIKTELH
ncbi:MAG: DUF2306 domain-containing protein [Flavobacterium sp.]